MRLDPAAEMTRPARPALRPGTALSAASPGRRSLIVEADDFGLVYAFNEGVRVAHQQGILTSTCLRANGYAYEHAVREILPQCPGLGVGVHLCLNEGEPVAPPGTVRALLTARQTFRSGYFWLMYLARTAAGIGQIEREFRAQIERILGDGVALDHLNSHQHVHMIPPIFRLVCRLAREYHIPCVRLTRELPYGAGGLHQRLQPYVNTNFLKHRLLNRLARVNATAAGKFGIPTTDYFVGVNYTAHMSLHAVIRGLRAAPYGSVELLLHPAVGPDPRDQRYPSRGLERYIAAPQRAMELRSLCAPELQAYIARKRWTPMTFATWMATRSTREVPMHSPVVPDPVRRLCDTVELRCPPWVSAAHPDSRAFAQLAAAQTQPGQRVLDLGTGTGILGICLAQLGREVVAVDISGAAVRTARSNAARCNVPMVCHVSDLLAAVEGKFDLIAFNLPYSLGGDNVATNVAKHLLRQVKWIRQRSGLAMPRPVLRYHQQLVARLTEQAPPHLKPGGALLLHAYESEVQPLAEVLPEYAEVELLAHPELTPNRTLGMLVRLEPGGRRRAPLPASGPPAAAPRAPAAPPGPGS